MKIICVGRNYAEHAAELNNEVPTQPLIFMKPDTSLLRITDFYFPYFTNDLHYECELVFRICKEGKNIPEKFAEKYVDKVSVGIDFTARDLQEECKKKGHPWERAKAFDNSAVVGEFKNISDFSSIESYQFSFQQNGQVVQKGDSALMIYSLAKIISNVSEFVTLKQGDLIFTGTPKGVGPVAIGDKLEAFLFEEKLLSIQVK
jgi:2-keto-4-pentenoate hydratase/2-oxohepta-3-ene-1,7-dioic acid hydratase in catechol pathway